MKRLLLVALALLTVLSSAACGGELPEDTASADSFKQDWLYISDFDYKTVYDITNSTAISVMSEMLGRIEEAVGTKPASSHSGNPESEYELQFALKSGREASETVYGEVMRYASASRSAYIIRAVENDVVVAVSDNNALRVAADRMVEFTHSGKFLIPEDIDEVVVFDTDSYLRQGTVEKLDSAAIGGDATLKSLCVNGSPVLGFDKAKTEYNAAVESPTGAKIEAVATESGAYVDISTSGNVTEIKVTSINRKNERVYKVSAFERVESEVVNKNGANAIVTYVIDDGNIDTAKFIQNKMAPKYPSLSASFALITKNLATLDITTNPDGTKEYTKDGDGFYTYKKNESQWSFWQQFTADLGDDGYELVSHSHTHKYWGENDNGGTFDYYNTAGEKFTSEDFPKGSVSKEFLASQQIIQDLDPTQKVATFVRSGLTAGGKNVKYSDTFWDAIPNSGAYIGARGTYTYPDRPLDMINKVEEFADPLGRFRLKSYMVQHYNTSATVKTTNANSGPAECLAAGIPYWTDYIDTAVENNAWAAFCIHTIKPDNYDARSGHYIFESQADELFAYTEKLSKENKVWVANLTDAFVYVNERSTSTVESYVDENGKLAVNLDDKEEGSIYNMALTVKVTLPVGKTSASLDGKALKSFVENGRTCIYVDVVPGNSVLIDMK